jgi:glutamate synthase domain-containing protein 3
MTPPAAGRPIPTVSIPDIRDYARINAELVLRLDEGHALVRLSGAEGQRLLAARLSGPWTAVVEIDGAVGPELAAELDAPGLTVVCLGRAADGAGRGLRAGRVLILGDAGDALGYTQEGGAIIAAAGAGPRAGLGQRGGTLLVLGQVGPLAAERQSGGRTIVFGNRLGPHPERGCRGGRLIRLASESDPLAGLDPAEASLLLDLGRDLRPWIHFPGSVVEGS